jgi:small-conductance mechanosensitive channel
VLVSVIALIAIVRILGFTSLLEAGGVIGFIGVLLALTQGAWAPDIISGLVILNSQLVEEGDVIEANDGSNKLLGAVYKTKVFHTELLDMVNNHRIMIQNARLRAMTIHNLSKFASAKGLREALHLKIGYAVPEQQVRAMVSEAFLDLQESGVQEIEFQHEPLIRVTDAGDYAIEWTLYYYTKQVRSLLQTRQTVLLAITNAARQAGISLATPLMVDSKDSVSN